MDSALAWIGHIAEWVGKFIPRWIILNTTEGAIKFVGGTDPVFLGPGIHWWWPAVTEMKPLVLARQSINLAAQTITTIDGKVIAVGGLLIYRITDPVRLVTDTWDPDQTIRDLAATALHDACSRLSWEDLQASKNTGALYKRVRQEMRRRLKPFGVKVLQATFTDFAPTRVIKLITSTSVEIG
jgi:regulator of protease activity HflC (stomatin/prohibitin superfamily)